MQYLSPDGKVEYCKVYLESTEVALHVMERIRASEDLGRAMSNPELFQRLETFIDYIATNFLSPTYYDEDREEAQELLRELRRRRA
jgi:hypothetical protein